MKWTTLLKSPFPVILQMIPPSSRPLWHKDPSELKTTRKQQTPETLSALHPREDWQMLVWVTRGGLPNSPLSPQVPSPLDPQVDSFPALSQCWRAVLSRVLWAHLPPCSRSVLTLTCKCIPDGGGGGQGRSLAGHSPCPVCPLCLLPVPQWWPEHQRHRTGLQPDPEVRHGRHS